MKYIFHRYETKKNPEFEQRYESTVNPNYHVIPPTNAAL